MHVTEYVPTPWSELDLHLGPILTRHQRAGSSGWVSCCAVLTRAHGLGYRPSSVRAWVLQRAAGDEQVLTVAASAASWSGCVLKTKAHVEATSSPDGSAQLRLSTARRVVGSVLSPVGPHLSYGARGTQLARQVTAIVALHALENLAPEGSGIHDPIQTRPRIGVQAGVTLLSAGHGLARAVEAGWLKAGPQRGGAGRPYRLARLDSIREEIALDHAGAIDALVAGTSHALAGVIRAAVSPLWGFSTSGITRRGWLVALADVAGVDAEAVFGVARPTAAKQRRLLAAAGVVPGDVEFLNQLDRSARTTDDGAGRSPQDRAEAAEADRAVQAAVRLEAVQAVRAERTATWEADRAARPGPVRAPAPVVERRTVPLPAGYVDAEQRAALAAKVSRAGWTIQIVDVREGVAHLERTAVTALAA